MDTGIMSGIFSELITCPRCQLGVDIVHHIEEKQGLAHLFNIKCRSLACQWKRSFYSSRKADRKGRGCKPFDVNLRAVIAFREMGKGHNGIETFCGYMNMPPSMQENAYNDLVKDTILPIHKEALTNDMLEAANDLHSSLRANKDQTIDNYYSDDEGFDIVASFNGTWQRRGYASLNGVVTAISIENGKCLAYI